MCSPAAEDDGSGRILEEGGRRWSSKRSARRRRGGDTSMTLQLRVRAPWKQLDVAHLPVIAASSIGEWRRRSASGTGGGAELQRRGCWRRTGGSAPVSVRTTRVAGECAARPRGERGGGGFLRRATQPVNRRGDRRLGSAARRRRCARRDRAAARARAAGSRGAWGRPASP